MSTSYALDLIIDGKTTRMMLGAIPASVVARFYKVDDVETLTLLAEKVLK